MNKDCKTIFKFLILVLIFTGFSGFRGVLSNFEEIFKFVLNWMIKICLAFPDLLNIEEKIASVLLYLFSSLASVLTGMYLSKKCKERIASAILFAVSIASFLMMILRIYIK